MIASASDDRLVKIWDVESGVCKETINHDTFVNSVSFSPSGALLASGSFDGTIKLWDVSSNKILHLLTEPEQKGINTVCFSPDGSFLASSSESQKGFSVWRVAEGCLAQKFSDQSKILTIAYSLEGTKLVTGSVDSRVILWNPDSGEKISEFKGHADEVSCVTFSPNGKLIISGSRDCTIKVWDVVGVNLLKSLEGHNGTVKGVVMTDDNQTIISCSNDKTIRLWDRSFGKRFKKSLELEPGGSSFISIEGNEMKFFDVEEGKLLIQLKGHKKAITCYRFSQSFTKEGHLLITGSADHTIKEWKSGTSDCLHSYEGHTGPINSVLYSFNEKREEKQIISASDDRTIKVWDKVFKKFLFNLTGHEGPVLSLALSQDGKKLLSGGEDKTARLWNLKTQKMEKEFRGEEIVRNIEFSNDETLVIGRNNDKIIIWAIDSGIILKEMQGIEGLREYKKFFNEEVSDFFNRSIISPDETTLSCSKMIVKNCINLSNENQAVFAQRKAIVFQK